MEHQRKKNKNILSHVIVGLIFVCVVLLVSEISINVEAELKANQSNQSYSAVMHDLASSK